VVESRATSQRTVTLSRTRLALAILAAMLAIASIAGGCGSTASGTGAVSPLPSTSSAGASDWQEMTVAGPGMASHDTYLDVAAPDAAHAWLLTSSGSVIHTSSGGANWSRQLPEASLEVEDDISGGITATDARHVWAVDGHGKIIATSDGGSSWHAQRTGGPSLNDVAFADQLHGWAVGDRGAILSTADGGISWQRQTVPTGKLAHSDRLVAVACADADHAFALRSRNQGSVASMRASVYATSDGGATWDALWTAKAGLRDLVCVDREQLWAAGGSGVFASTDGGSTWKREPLAGNALDAVAAGDERHIWATGFGFGRQQPRIMSSADSGAAWTAVPVSRITGVRDQMATLWSLGFSDADHGWAVGENRLGGVVLRCGPPQEYR
jgi:photosystem II stability/assembly factor-like uncharacterized protein